MNPLFAYSSTSCMAKPLCYWHEAEWKALCQHIIAAVLGLVLHTCLCPTVSGMHVSELQSAF